MDLQGKRAVIVGGGSGIGAAAVRLFAGGGASVLAVGRDLDKLGSVQAGAPGPGLVDVEQADATQAGQLTSLFDRAGPVDYLVLSVSSGGGGGPFRSLPLERLRAGFDGKFWPYLQALRAALPALRPDGSVTFVTAGSARAALPGTAGLAAINGALEAMVRPLAAELAPVRVNAVSPGIIKTPWWDGLAPEQREAAFASAARWLPAGRVGEPEEAALAVLLVAVNTYITGTVIECDGGAHLAAGG